MTHRDRTPIVLALVAEAVHLHACDHADDHADLSDGLAIAVAHGAVADLWPPTGVDESAARWLASVLTGDADRDNRRGDDALVAATSAARRLADVAASLAVRGDSHHREARALWDAASRLLGFEAEVEVKNPSQTNQPTPTPAETMNPGHRPADYSARLADVMAENLALRDERDDARREIERFAESHVRSQDTIATLRSNLDAQTREHAAEVARLAERIAALESDLKVARAAAWPSQPSEKTAADPAPRREPEPWYAIRLAVIRAGAKDFRVCYGAGAIGNMPASKDAVVVDLGERLTLDGVAAIISAHGRPRGSYLIRAVGDGKWKCFHRPDGDASACDHCSLKG